ncbi:hypothetical protein B0H16DRAFT_1742763 [Mycena metata]|uniref:F-box domain-containing protein n=1 Tax=Mycena metata TaxID=1033252 RepID=A0AAD7MET9_9AGAR|nr:hypothetical protein B0H16DRAFT_1742763 [Mycena metata]
MTDSDNDVPPLEYAWVLDNCLTRSYLSDAYLDALLAFDYKLSKVHITDLPSEIITNILKLSPVTFACAPHFYEGTRHVIRMVSPYWNTLVKKEPALWSQIYVRQRTVVGKLALWIQRAGRVPISFAFHLSEPFVGPTVLLDPSHYRRKWLDLVATIAPTMARCARVSIQTHNPHTTRFLIAILNTLDASAVERIDLRLCPYSMSLLRRVGSPDSMFALPPLFMDNVPRLRYLTFRAFFTAWGASPILSNLTTLRLDELYDQYSPTVEEIFVVLGAAPRLETLFFLDVACIGFETFTLDPPVMAFLDTLHFAGTDDACSCLLSLISMPAITHLHLRLDSSLCLQVFLAHCTTLCGHITMLSLDVPMDTIRALVNIFEAFPRLELLDARDMTAYFTVGIAFCRLPLGLFIPCSFHYCSRRICGTTPPPPYPLPLECWIIW